MTPELFALLSPEDRGRLMEICEWADDHRGLYQAEMIAPLLRILGKVLGELGRSRRLHLAASQAAMEITKQAEKAEAERDEALAKADDLAQRYGEIFDRKDDELMREKAKNAELREMLREAEAEVFRQHGPVRRGGGSVVVECWDEQRGLLSDACHICCRVFERKTEGGA